MKDTQLFLNEKFLKNKARDSGHSEGNESNIIMAHL